MISVTNVRTDARTIEDGDRLKAVRKGYIRPEGEIQGQHSMKARSHLSHVLARGQSEVHLRDPRG